MDPLENTINEIILFHTDLPSNETMRPHVREFIKMLKKATHFTLKWNVASATTNIVQAFKRAANKRFVRPVLEYTSSVLDLKV